MADAIAKPLSQMTDQEKKLLGRKDTETDRKVEVLYNGQVQFDKSFPLTSRRRRFAFSITTSLAVEAGLRDVLGFPDPEKSAKRPKRNKEYAVKGKGQTLVLATPRRGISLREVAPPPAAAAAAAASGAGAGTEELQGEEVVLMEEGEI
jgi:hypothetical protein